MAKKLTTKDFKNKAFVVHGDLYDYSKATYINTRTKVKIVCPVHGAFEQTPNNHIIGRQGCPVCRHIKASASKTSNTSKFIEKANMIHNNYYTYSKTCYARAITKVTITCPVHGNFEQRPAEHLSGRGCSLCSKELMGWTHTKWKERGESSNLFNGYKLYIVEMFNDSEKFIKIGKTFTTLSHRFCSLPYQWRTVKVIEGDAITISELELELHNKFIINKYTPNTKFGGWQECFEASIEKRILQIV